MSGSQFERNELFGLKERLEKCLHKNDGGSDSEEAISDLLNVLNQFRMTVELLADTRIGQSLGEIMKKYGEADVAQQAKKLLKKWKKDLRPSETSGTKDTSSSSQSEDPPAILPPQSETDSRSESTPMGRSTSDGDGSWGFEEDYANLEPRRLSMVQAILTGLLLTTDVDEYWAKFLAFNIDREVNSFLPDPKQYMSKARTIASNLRTNQTLREQVYQGDISPATLARMNPRDLADKSVQEAIAKKKHELEKGRETDMYQELREKAQKAIGVNHEGGEFTCGRCKGTRTSHYAMQTRSSDEPMTIFITCLTCKKRWRE